MRAAKQQAWKDTTDREIERFVRLLRTIVVIHDQRTPNLLDAFEKLSKIFPRLRLRVVADSDLPEAEARAQPSHWIIKIRQGIYNGLLRGDAGARWTFAHELGHVFLQHPGKPFRKRKDAADDLLERQAHLFAAQFLAPTELARGCKKPEEIRTTFRLSNEAAQRRYSEIILDDRSRLFGTQGTLKTQHEESSLIEDLTAEICRSVKDTISNGPLTPDLLIEPWKNNLFSASLATAKAAQLLLDSYESVRPDMTQSKYCLAAALTAAIETVRPIREIGSNDISPKDVAALNGVCARKVAMRLLGLYRYDGMEFAINIGPRANYFWYLHTLVERSDELIKDRSTILNIRDLPTYHYYNQKRDICWYEIDDLAKLSQTYELLSKQA